MPLRDILKCLYLYPREMQMVRRNLLEVYKLNKDESNVNKVLLVNEDIRLVAIDFVKATKTGLQIVVDAWNRFAVIF